MSQSNHNNATQVRANINGFINNRASVIRNDDNIIEQLVKDIRVIFVIIINNIVINSKRKIGSRPGSRIRQMVVTVAQTEG